ncbi:MAG: hypothetical protein VBE63_14750 [Lamprobacter sp.]|uniref:hypothetical protein n=1 Tax=Lamprobacter sp. TaxID=3100796 RepID=UPI002B25DBBA|nr:hypothetical protein [Lamprobacter sp.]MEA3641181.1 hypothetical protein [Lamprobacter sp.]
MGWTRLLGSALRIALAIVIPLAVLGALGYSLPPADHQAQRALAARAAGTEPSGPIVRPPTRSGIARPSPATSAERVVQAPPKLSEPEPPIRWADSTPQLRRMAALQSGPNRGADRQHSQQPPASG